MRFPAGAPLIDDNYRIIVCNHYIELVTNDSDDRRLIMNELMNQSSFSKYSVEQLSSHDI